MAKLSKEKPEWFEYSNIIPPITNPLGRYWEQPEVSEILADDTHAVMTETTLNKLANYSHSQPTGAYVGKMWKAKNGDGWVLCWFGNDWNEGYVLNYYREILVVN